MKIIGIDPGLSGAIAILENNKVLNIFDMPVMAEGKKNKRQLNSAQLVKLIKDQININEEVSVVVVRGRHALHAEVRIRHGPLLAPCWKKAQRQTVSPGESSTTCANSWQPLGGCPPPQPFPPSKCYFSQAKLDKKHFNNFLTLETTKPTPKKEPIPY